MAMDVSPFWIAVAAAAVGASIPAIFGFVIHEIRRKRAKERERGQALSDLANALAENMRIVLRIPDEIKGQRAPANFLLADGWMHAASRLASGKEDITADFRIFFEESKRLNEFLRKFDGLSTAFNIEDHPGKQEAFQRMLQEQANNIVSLCENLLKNGKYLMGKIKEDPAWQRIRPMNHKKTSDEKDVGTVEPRDKAHNKSVQPTPRFARGG